MVLCETCRYRADIGGGRITCQKTNASPRTATYVGSGVPPLRFDPSIVVACDDWDADDWTPVAPAASSLSIAASVPVELKR